jgi:D-alanyl-lipoteichoic acid acyltransferase DltB (MBOAT superfamily)
MLFNSFEFFVFLVIVFVSYWFIFKRNLQIQNVLLLVSSYVFYGWWDWRFLSLIFISSLIDFTIGFLLGKYQSAKTRKAIISVSVIINLGLLGFFKYFNFFIDSFTSLMNIIGLQANEMSLRIILPVGISFYTFQSLSYTIDVYRNQLKPTRNIISFFSFVSFFPQLVAGPIERAANLLPQFYVKRTFDLQLASDGLRQILWGFFKKLVIADNCALYVNKIFSHYPDESGMTLLLGAILFAFQIYCDFSGYSDIAIGTARIFGFRLMRNFAYPYFSRDIAEFWRHWHISLSSWFRDYLYIPLGGSRVNKLKQVRNIFIVFTVSGFWHGANWTFIAWGFLHALYFLPLLLMKKNRVNLDIVAHGRIFPSIREFGNILLTFLLVCIAWIFFRSENLQAAFDYFFRMQAAFFVRPEEALKIISPPVLYCLLLLIIMEWKQRSKQHALEIQMLPQSLRWIVYIVIIFLIFMYGNFNKTEFIYFAF